MKPLKWLLLPLLMLPAPAADLKLHDGTPESVGASVGRLASVLTRVDEWVDADITSGALVLVARNGVIIAQHAAGFADAEKKIRFTPDTICQLASVTKPVTATAVMMLVEQGKLALDDPIEKFIPAFRDQQLVIDGRAIGRRAVTIRHLLTHTSGMPQDVPSRKRPPAMHRDWLSRKLADVADEAGRMNLTFEPGSRYSYCNAGIATAGRVIEIVSGQPYDAFLKARLFERLGMKDSSFQPAAADARRVAVLYTETGGTPKERYRYDPSFRITNPAPNGGLFSTARDMAAFVQMVLNEGRYNGAQILSPASVREMLRDQTPSLPEVRGLGWSLQAPGARRPLKDAIFTHSGSSGTFYWGDTRRGVVGILFSQTAGARVTAAHREFFERVTAAVDPPEPRLDPAWQRHVIVSGFPVMTAVAADFTGDGRVDVIANGRGRAMLYVAPDWKEVLLHAGPLDLIHSAVMDVDGDGHPDYIGARYSPGLIFWLERPANPLQGPWPYHLVDDQVNGIHGLAVGDIDGDRKPDLAATSAQATGAFPNSLAWFHVPPNPRSAARWERYVFAAGDAPGLTHYLGLGDVNGDGRMDAATGAKLAQGGNYYAWWEAPANPRQPWRKHVIAEKQEGATNILMADVNGDGRTDFIASRGHGGGLVWYEAPDWKPHEITPALTGPHSLAIGDLDGDGDIDIVTCAKHDFVVAWFENDGHGNFTMHPIYTDQAAYDVRLVDMDGDGDLDVLVAGQESRNVVWYENRLPVKRTSK